MTNVAALGGLLLGCETCGQDRFIKRPEDWGLAACGRWVVALDVLTRGLILGQDTFLVKR